MCLTVKGKGLLNILFVLRIILLIDDSYWLQGSMKEKIYQTTKECFLDCHVHIFKKVSAFLGIRQIFQVNVMARY
jgi:hypothetical protein